MSVSLLHMPLGKRSDVLDVNRSLNLKELLIDKYLPFNICIKVQLLLFHNYFLHIFQHLEFSLLFIAYSGHSWARQLIRKLQLLAVSLEVDTLWVFVFYIGWESDTLWVFVHSQLYILIINKWLADWHGQLCFSITSDHQLHALFHVSYFVSHRIAFLAHGLIP